MMDDIVRLTEQIHKFVRDQLIWEESLKLLDEIVESGVDGVFGDGEGDLLDGFKKSW